MAFVQLVRIGRTTSRGTQPSNSMEIVMERRQCKLLTLMDDIKSDPAPFLGIALVIALLVGLVARTAGGRDDGDEFDEFDETGEFLDEDDGRVRRRRRRRDRRLKLRTHS